ncbi:hypothetical protein BTN50_0431 [Candidatus Enterovibrio altilux]|uniref:Mobile element protein n=1 Tax=Candidatus Enterovibrio altilux TaxID=1927128 RepID=A0A291B7I0_9GAMM|nr:hypothetical protein BTN50_0431 [Candidatus Enterovibrio luxaltus]
MNKLNSISPSVTFDALHSAAMIAYVFISTAKCNLCQTRRSHQCHAFLLFIHLHRRL